MPLELATCWDSARYCRLVRKNERCATEDWNVTLLKQKFGRTPAKLAWYPTCRVSNSVVDVTKLREDLLLKLERERSAEVAGLRSKQKQVGAETDAHT